VIGGSDPRLPPGKISEVRTIIRRAMLHGIVYMPVWVHLGMELKGRLLEFILAGQ